MRRSLSLALLFALLLAAPARAAKARRGPLIDLHSHLVGAISSAGLYEIAVRHDLQFPSEHFGSMGITPPPAALKGQGRMVSMQDFERHAAAEDRARFVELLTFPEGSRYANLEVTYGFRRALMPNHVLDDVLRRIGREARAGGVRYLELSTNKIFEMPGPLRESLRRAIDEIEAETGVRLRFLHSFRRDRAVEANLAELHEAAAQGLYARGSLVVGIDVVGREHNSIDDQAPLLKAVRTMKATSPDMRGFEVQVHAGETPDFPDNVRRAILLGATRIAHGVYGISDEVIALARKRRVVFELALTSNTKLGTAASHAIYRKLVNARVPVTVTTDGPGIFGVQPREELTRAIRALRLNVGQIRRVYKTNAKYMLRKGVLKPSRTAARARQAKEGR